jgi:hypothetical protein
VGSVGSYVELPITYSVAVTVTLGLIVTVPYIPVLVSTIVTSSGHEPDGVAMYVGGLGEVIEVFEYSGSTEEVSAVVIGKPSSIEALVVVSMEVGVSECFHLNGEGITRILALHVWYDRNKENAQKRADRTSHGAGKAC